MTDGGTGLSLGTFAKKVEDNVGAVAKGNLLPSRMFLKKFKKNGFFLGTKKNSGATPLLVSTQEYPQTNFFFLNANGCNPCM
jgi:hypothetical protein